MTRKRILQFLRITISLALMAWLYSRVDISELGRILGGARLPLLLLFVLMLFVNTAISAFKWQIVLRADGVEAPFRRLMGSYLVGSFFNIFLPSNIGGDAYRIFDVAKLTRRASHSFASVLADRLSGFVALVVLGFLFGILGYKSLPQPHVLVVPLMAAALLFVAIAMLFQKELVRWFFRATPLGRLHKLSSFADGLLQSVDEYKKSPGLFARILGLSFLFQLFAIVCVFVLAAALRLEIPLLYFAIFIPFISLIEALPISIYGLGIRDATYVYFFGAVGVPHVACLTLAVAYVLMTLVYSLSGGVVFMLRTDSKTATDS